MNTTITLAEDNFAFFLMLFIVLLLYNAMFLMVDYGDKDK
jgi:hypothetical protein